MALLSLPIITLPLVTTTSCTNDEQINDHNLSNPRGGILLNQKQQASGLKTSAYANLLNLINPNTNKTYYPWDAKMTKTGFDLTQFQRNLNQVAPEFKIQINEDEQIQIADGHNQLSLLIFDPNLQRWEPAVISGFKSQIDLELIRTGIITDVSFSELKWLAAQLPLNSQLLTTIPNEVIWRLSINSQPVLTKQWFSQGWQMEIDVKNEQITFSDPLFKYQNQQWTKQILVPATNSITRTIADGLNPQRFIDAQDILFRLKQILNLSLIDLPYSASGLALLINNQTITNWNQIFTVSLAQQEWYDALINYRYYDQPLVLTLSDPENVSDLSDELSANLTINHPQFSQVKPVRISFNTNETAALEQLAFKFSFAQNEGFVQPLVTEILKRNPNFQQTLLQWFNQDQPQVWDPLSFTISSSWLAGIPAWFNKDLTYDLANKIITTHPQSQLFINQDQPQNPTTLINDPSAPLINPNQNQFNFANRSLSWLNQSLTVINQVRFPLDNTILSAKIVRLNNFDKKLGLQIAAEATWIPIDPQFNNPQSSPLTIEIVFESWS